MYAKKNSSKQRSLDKRYLTRVPTPIFCVLFDLILMVFRVFSVFAKLAVEFECRSFLRTLLLQRLRPGLSCQQINLALFQTFPTCPASSQLPMVHFRSNLLLHFLRNSRFQQIHLLQASLQLPVASHYKANPRKTSSNRAYLRFLREQMFLPPPSGKTTATGSALATPCVPLAKRARHRLVPPRRSVRAASALPSRLETCLPRPSHSRPPFTPCPRSP